jgi:hypothetical protein
MDKLATVQPGRLVAATGARLGRSMDGTKMGV